MSTREQEYLNELGDQREIAALRAENGRLREALIKARTIVAAQAVKSLDAIDAALKGNGEGK